MKGTKKYLQPKDMILNAIHDLAELQKAETLSCDSARGIVRLRVAMYAFKRDYVFTVTDIVGRRSGVTIELAGEASDVKRLIDHEFALLDYVLMDRTRIELAEIEEEEKRI